MLNENKAYIWIDAKRLKVSSYQHKLLLMKGLDTRKEAYQLGKIGILQCLPAMSTL